MLRSINWPNFIVFLPLLLEILGDIGIVIICCPVCDVINFENSNGFLIKPFFFLTKKSKKLNISKTKGACNMKKNKFHDF